MAERKVPRIRFKGFEEDWEQRKLEEMAVISTGYPFNSNEFSPEGKYLVITNGNIQDSSTNVDVSVGNRIKLLDRKILDSYILDIGDILITMDGTVGRTAKVAGNGMILAQRVGRVKPIGNTEFMYQALSTGDFSKAMTELSHGGTIKHISLNEISLFEFKSPVREREQNTVGKFLYLFDSLLSLHQRKLEKLKILKKAMLEKMFPKNGAKVPEIRFSGFTDDWEQRKLGEIASEILAGGDVNKKSIQEVGKYPVIANALTDGGIIGYYNEEYRISAPALTVTGRGDIGHAKVRLVNFTPVVRLLAIKAKHDMFFLENNINIRKPITESTGVPQLTIPQLANYELCIPKKRSEEESVGILFKYIDSLLSLHQRKLEKLRQIKKSMLERMFV